MEWFGVRSGALLRFSRPSSVVLYDYCTWEPLAAFLWFELWHLTAFVFENIQLPAQDAAIAYRFSASEDKKFSSNASTVTVTKANKSMAEVAIDRRPIHLSLRLLDFVL